MSKPVDIDPILRNTLRYTLSAKEYKTLHEYLISRSPRAVRRKAPRPPKYDSIVQSKNEFNVAAIRASLRVFIATQTGLTIWELITSSLLAKGGRPKKKPRTSIFKSPKFRLSLSLSLILLLHRLLYRFFSRLRVNLLTKDAAPFRRRNPRISKSLTSNLAPAIGASLAGFALGVYPADQLRVTISIYAATRAAEFTYNTLEKDGWFSNKPSWVGSWMLMPLATGQLLHAFVFDRDCFPRAYGDFALNHTPNYVQRRPESYPPKLSWPSQDTIVDSLAEISRLNWPPFTSPILFPNNPSPLPSTLNPIAPITSPAHPSITSLSCALLHPTSPSCLRTYLTFYLRAFPPMAKFFALIFSLLSLPRYKSFLASPIHELNSLAKRTLRMSAFLTGAIGTAWGSICFFAHFLPRTFLPQARWFWGGFAGACGEEEGWWKGFRGGDVWVFVLGLGVLNAVYEVDREAVRGGGVRMGVGWLRGEELFAKRDETQESDEKKEG
ncbi:hypothetical protein G7Y79_00040g076620 [Physcia stellaris]|nr:hypothetical protein G7Y79_00040g076620 [Physcia stellaris]